MSFDHGSKAVFKLGGQDYSQYLEEVDPSFDREMAEMRHLGKKSVERLAGMRMGSINLSGDFDPILDQALYDAWNSDSPVAWEYYPQGLLAGAPKYSGNCWISNYKPGPAASNGVGKVSATLQSDGDITREQNA